ncbi:hypothetical protein [Candidatus Protochlamydia amoebophila]|uniref:Uncharacterized protein n=1 Tax=Candidatus Protochlamydia amoebophila TaxID=362787 RepID=A0A0C1H0Z3_9BACT|nr:hypothetical protein [Candidatus Protochlamydia amoebophila]KIC71414.1 hypothetical protein DB44_DT00490 [Candidatus Protochlamydia amoebophila]
MLRIINDAMIEYNTDLLDRILKHLDLKNIIAFSSMRKSSMSAIEQVFSEKCSATPKLYPTYRKLLLRNRSDVDSSHAQIQVTKLNSFHIPKKWKLAEIAQELWLDSEAPLSEDMIDKVNEVDTHLQSEVTKNVRELAFKGLADLFVLRDRDRVSRLTELALKKYPNSKFLQKIVKKADRYWETHSLIMQSLEELAKNSDYKEYINEIVDSLVKIQNETIHIEEQNTIQESLKVLEEENKRLQEAIEEEELILATKKRDKQRKRSNIQTPFIAHDMANLQLEEFEASPINLSDFMIGKTPIMMKEIENMRQHPANEEIQILNLQIHELETQLQVGKEEKEKMNYELEAMLLVEKELQQLHSEEKGYENRLKAIYNNLYN